MTKPEDELSGFYDDYGTKFDPNLMEKPSLCTTCRKDDDQKEERFCRINRISQLDKDEFICEAYVSRFEEKTFENEENSNDDDIKKF